MYFSNTCDLNCPQTGLCVYEVDDPSQRYEGQDESSRLLKRVVELETVIREVSPDFCVEYFNSCTKLKSKPRSRWALSSDMARSPPTSVASGYSYSPTAFSESPTFSSQPFPSAAPYDSPPLDVSPYSGKDVNLIFAESPHCTVHDDSNWRQLDDLSIGKSSYAQSQPCSCLSNLPAYQTMLELSLRLHKAAMVLGQYPLHQAGGFCFLNEKLAELDAITACVDIHI